MIMNKARNLSERYGLPLMRAAVIELVNRRQVRRTHLRPDFMDEHIALYRAGLSNIPANARVVRRFSADGHGLEIAKRTAAARPDWTETQCIRIVCITWKHYKCRAHDYITAGGNKMDCCGFWKDGNCIKIERGLTIAKTGNPYSACIEAAKKKKKLFRCSGRYGPTGGRIMCRNEVIGPRDICEECSNSKALMMEMEASLIREEPRHALRRVEAKLDRLLERRTFQRHQRGSGFRPGLARKGNHGAGV